MTAPGVIVFDIDNTVYNFVDFFAPAFRSMVHALSYKSKIEEAIIVESAKAVYQQARTLEHQILIQNMEIFAHFSPEAKALLINFARQAFSKTRNKYLTPYDGIKYVIERAKEEGYKCIFVTNAPIYHVHKRLVDLDIFNFADGLFAWRGSKIDQRDSEHFRKYKERLEAIITKNELIVELEDEQRKPSSYSYEYIKKKFPYVSNFIVVGDSISKDLTPAKLHGYNTIFAKYGTVVKKKNIDTLLNITPWSNEEVSQHNIADLPPDYVAESPLDIITFLGISPNPRQGSFFL
jgi:FMN phosphatase YigB (HAD superfamily)